MKRIFWSKLTASKLKNHPNNVWKRIDEYVGGQRARPRKRRTRARIHAEPRAHARLSLFTPRKPSFDETNVDYDRLSDIFSAAESTEADSAPKPKQEAKKDANQTVSVIDGRKSFSISIVLTSLHADPDKVGSAGTVEGHHAVMPFLPPQARTRDSGLSLPFGPRLDCRRAGEPGRRLGAVERCDSGPSLHFARRRRRRRPQGLGK